ncbi:MAG: hypothetical protein A2189_02665 [Paenibacillus sp. RIFOXYA1_FULL_44_5]|nr:MAG: hypothetical protein A2189_02665 [Paenibacillus sp. RIFOXYA1_FULL_44_5]
MKPELGKAGKGIMRIEHIHEKKGANVQNPSIRLSIQEKKKSQIHTYNNLVEVWKQVSEFIHEKEYIAQQGIQLTSYNNRPFDLRILVQKNNRGEWEISGVGARIAGKTSITTHVPRGGSIDDPDKLLTASFGKNKSKIMLRRVNKAALTIAQQIEKKSHYMLGEMSIDLGIDENGRIWFFEANSKPMKFDEPSIRQKSLEQLIQYTKYIANKKTVKSNITFID